MAGSSINKVKFCTDDVCQKAMLEFIAKKINMMFKMTVDLLSCIVDIFILILHCSKLFKMIKFNV